MNILILNLNFHSIGSPYQQVNLYVIQCVFDQQMSHDLNSNLKSNKYSIDHITNRLNWLQISNEQQLYLYFAL